MSQLKVSAVKSLGCLICTSCLDHARKKKRLLMTAVLSACCLIVMPTALFGVNGLILEPFRNRYQLEETEEIKRCLQARNDLQAEVEQANSKVLKSKIAKEASHTKLKQLERHRDIAGVKLNEAVDRLSEAKREGAESSAIRKLEDEERDAHHKYEDLAMEVELQSRAYGRKKKRYQELMANSEPLKRRLSKKKDECRALKAIKMIDDEQFQFAEKMIERIQSDAARDSFLRYLNRKADELVEMVKLASSDCRPTKLKDLQQTVNELSSRLPRRYQDDKGEELQELYIQAVDREKQVGELSRNAYELWKEAKKSYRLGDYRNTRNFGNQAIGMLREAYKNSKCEGDKQHILGVINRMKTKLGKLDNVQSGVAQEDKCEHQWRKKFNSKRDFCTDLAKRYRHSHIEALKSRYKEYCCERTFGTGSIYELGK